MINYDRITGFADEINDSLDRQIEGLTSLNMHYVEMRGVDGSNLIYHDDAKVKEIRKRLDDAGISLSALGSPLGKIGIEEDFEPHFEDFKRAVEIAHMMNTENIRMFSFYVSDDKRKDPAIRDEVFRRLGRFAEYAAANDVVLLHENEKGIYGDKAYECREIMDEFASDHFKAIFDFANFVQVGQDTLEAYRLLKDYIVYIHVKDALTADGQVVPAGFGDGHVAEILDMLFDGGFNGFLSLEPHLSDFRGFADLEKGTLDITAGHNTLSGLESFTLAYESLERITNIRWCCRNIRQACLSYD